MELEKELVEDILDAPIYLSKVQQKNLSQLKSSLRRAEAFKIPKTEGVSGSPNAVNRRSKYCVQYS